MAQAQMHEILNTLFTAPVKASVMAEAEYRKVWIEWLDRTEKLIPADAPEAVQKAVIEAQLDMAPIMKFEAAIDLGVTMRLVSIKEGSGGGSLGLNVGAFQVSGSFGFMSSNTSESILEARARYQLSNTNEQTLRGFLAAAGVPVEKKEQLADARRALKAGE